VTKNPERSHYDADFERVRAILREWDPIGVYSAADTDENERPPDEYDSYIPPILSSLRSGGGAQRIASYLAFVREKQMGLPPLPSRDREFAERIEKWWGDQRE